MNKNWLDSMNFLKDMTWRKAGSSSAQEERSSAVNEPNAANEERGLGVNTLLLILVSVMALSITSIGGFGYYTAYLELQSAKHALEEVELDVKMIIPSQGAEISFNKQIRAWKNVLIRGGDPAAFEKHLKQFVSHESKVQEHLTSLKNLMLTQPQLMTSNIAQVELTLKLHTEMGDKYRDALNVYEQGNMMSAHPVEALVKGLDSIITDKMAATTDLIKEFSIKNSTNNKKLLDEAFVRTTKIFIAVVLGTLVLAIALTLPIRKNTNKILDKVTNLLTNAEQQNQRNQKAILRLLDEVADLADGDLTRKPVVTEDVTGAIADSLGYAIETLRTLVGAINVTAGQVAAEAAATQEKALQLTAASDRQAQEINTAGTAVTELAQFIEQVSLNAIESSSVAKKSVDIAKKGAQTVQGTIQGMEAIREQIQETAKRIKRLGESSQEIGEIVALINDIADQTSILALNASIQAAMAGEAGRGFSVVADEVQRLSERVGNSTKQIESLVKAIQTDTSEAVISMEKSTSDVMLGARLAQDAGKSLTEIETVSISLNTLIEGISVASRQQSSTAGKVSHIMEMIQDITTQTSQGTRQAATSIGQLTGMADELKKSVAGFKLPS